MCQVSRGHVRKALGEACSFLSRHWVHFLLLIPGAFAFTIFHEAGHACAVWVQGGTVTEFVWLPSPGEWGHIRYGFPAGQAFSSFVISLAPYCASAALCAVAVMLAILRAPQPHWAASTSFVWLYLVPLGDVANVSLGYLSGAGNDFYHAFGPASLDASAGLLTAGAAAAAVGYFVQRRLYGNRAVGAAAYCVLGTIAVCLLAGLSVIRF